MSLERLLEDIRTAAASEGLSRLERTRLERDLARVRGRLVGGQYALSSFGTNTFDVPDRKEELLTELSFHVSVGRTWAALLEATGLAGVDTLLDLCPGYAPKVELGLVFAGFGGRVVVVDRDLQALAQLERFLALFSPRFRLEARVENLFTGRLEPAPLVTANHVLDDLVVGWVGEARGLAPGAVYEEEGVLVSLWDAVEAERGFWLQALVPPIARAFSQAVAPGGALVMAQYPSYLERSLGLGHATRFNAELLERVGAGLLAQGFALDEQTPRRALAAGGHFSAEHCRVLRRGG